MEFLEDQIPPEIAHFTAQRRSPRTDEEIDLFMKTIAKHYSQPDRGAGLLNYGGADAVTHYSDIKRVVAELHRVEPITQYSSFVDFGSGAGFFPIYVALKHRCASYGVESQPASVAISRVYARWAFLENLNLNPRRPETWLKEDEKWQREHGPVALFVAAYFEALAPNWIPARGITHVLSYDAVFNADALEAVWKLVHANAVVGASTKKNRSFIPSSALELGSVPSVKVGHSSFAFVVWKNEVLGRVVEETSSEIEKEPDRTRQKTSWLMWFIVNDEGLLIKMESTFGAEWRAEVGGLLAKNAFNIDRTLLFLETLDTKGKRKGPDRHTMLRK
jgi:hypothetical protein